MWISIGTDTDFIKGQAGYFLTRAPFSHVFLSKWLMRTTILENGPVLRENAAAVEQPAM